MECSCEVERTLDPRCEERGMCGAERNSQMDDQSVANIDPRTCTCHPDDSPPAPCPQKFAYGDCVAAMNEDFLKELREFIKGYSNEPGISGEELVECLEAEAARLRAQMRRLEG